MGQQARRALALLRNSGLVEADVRCRYLAARCLADVCEWEDCLTMLGGCEDADIESVAVEVGMSRRADIISHHVAIII